MKYYLLIFFAAIILQACSGSGKQAENPGSNKTLIPDIPSSLDTEPNIFKGFYTYGNEVNTFRDCKNQASYWVNDSIVDLKKQYEQTNRFPAYPYETVYAEVRGYLAGKSQLGYASEHENVLVVTEVIKIEPKNFRTACYNYEFIILGNEPFWSLDIIPEEHRIVLKEVGHEKVWEFLYAPANVKNNVYRYEVSNPAHDKLIAVIKEEACSDGMSDRKYSYSAEVTINGTKYKGCAIKKGDLFSEGH